MTVVAVSGREQWALSPTYVRAVQAAGGIPVLIPLLSKAKGLWSFYEGLDGLVLCGGGDIAPEIYGARDVGHCLHIVPERDAVELALTRRALADGLPLLGICRGIQVLNVAAGGTLIQDIASGWPNPLPHATSSALPRDHLAHRALLEPDSLVSRLYSDRSSGEHALHEVWVNSSHHQAIDRLGSGLRVTARSEDGIVEAVEGNDKSRWVVGVQWHPEELQNGTDGLHRALFVNLVRHAAGVGEN